MKAGPAETYALSKMDAPSFAASAAACTKAAASVVPFEKKGTANIATYQIYDFILKFK